MTQKSIDTDAGGSADVVDAAASSRQYQQAQSHNSAYPDPPLPAGDDSTDATSPLPTNNGFLSWIHSERECFARILFCAALGALLGFAIGAGWLNSFGGFLGYGSTSHYQYMIPEYPTNPHGGMSTKTGLVDSKAVRYFVVSAWRVRLAKNIRSTILYQLLTFKKTPWGIIEDMFYSSPNQLWVLASPLWPLNWLLFREVDLSQVDVGDMGFSPFMVSCLSCILPWHRNLIQSLALKEKIKVDLRYDDGYINEPTYTSTTSPTSFFSSIFSSKQSNQPINPYFHPMAFHALREHIIRYDNGFVHPDLGFLVPAPSGAERGIGMIRDTYTKCQVHCNPGTAEEKIRHKTEMQTQLENSKLQDRIDEELMEEMMKEFPGISTSSITGAVNTASSSTLRVESVPSQTHNQPIDVDKPLDPMRNTTTYAGIHAAVQLQQTLYSNSPYSQSEILLRIPIEAQITRKLALDTLLGLIPLDQTSRQAHMEELDDGFVLAVYLAYERGLGTKSRIWPYIATLPNRPTCALNWGWRQSIVDVVTALSMEMGTDVQGWPNEISKATEIYEMIVLSLSRLFGDLLPTRPGEDVTENIRWALCHVASRAIAGRESHGSLRLVPMMDMINHDAAAGKFMELSGTEKLEDGDILDADETDAGTFVVRSRRHGERKPLKRGQELMANYNVPHYSPLDWFLNMGYIPPERAGTWTMLEAALPRSYRGGFSRTSNAPGVKAFGGDFGRGKPDLQSTRQYTPQQSRPR